VEPLAILLIFSKAANSVINFANVRGIMHTYINFFLSLFWQNIWLRVVPRTMRYTDLVGQSCPKISLILQIITLWFLKIDCVSSQQSRNNITAQYLTQSDLV